MKLDSERSSTARDGTSSASAPSFPRAGSQSRAARSGVFSSSLEALGERLNPSTWFGREANRTPKAAVSRLREVLDRDRALVAANPELNDLPDDDLPAPEVSVAPARAALMAAAQEQPAARAAPVPEAVARAEVPARAEPALRADVAAQSELPLAPAITSTRVGTLPPGAHPPPLPTAPIARAPVAVGRPVDEPAVPLQARAVAPLGAFSEAPVPAYAREARPAEPARQAVVAPASVTAASSAPAAPSVIASRVVMVCNEPIRTRTMARLLASQGHRERALSIYEYLLSRNGNDEALRAEADALRSEPS